jgi:hypothetical protein
MTAIALARIVLRCGELGIAVEARGDALWIANPAAPAYGVTVRAVGGELEWSLALARPVADGRMSAAVRALHALNAEAGGGAWQLDPAARTVRFVLRTPAGVAGDSWLAALQAVIAHANAHAHALIEVIEGREPADYLR